jgi:hypothetical protein
MTLAKVTTTTAATANVVRIVATVISVCDCRVESKKTESGLDYAHTRFPVADAADHENRRGR